MADCDLMCFPQESLGGNAKTSLVIAVANAVQHCEETLQSLQFGSRAMRVQTQAVVNECIDFKVLTLADNLFHASASSYCLIQLGAGLKQRSIIRSIFKLKNVPA